MRENSLTEVSVRGENQTKNSYFFQDWEILLLLVCWTQKNQKYLYEEM